MTLSVAIVGGGIGGLSLAAFLSRSGCAVRVFERSDRSDDAGSALGMWPSALSALDRLGVGDQVRASGSRQAGGQIRSADGRTMGRVRSPGEATVLITRGRLLEILSSAVPHGAIEFGTPVTDPGVLRDYDVVVAADGVRSAIRAALVGPRYDARPLGYSALVGAASGSTDIVCETWGRGRLFGVTPRDGDHTNWFAAFRQAASVPAPDDPVGYLRKRYGDWHADVAATLERIEPASIIHYHAKEVPRLPSYVYGNVALIGDAAHAMAPNLGRGACETIIDAVVLGEELTQHGVSGGLTAYDRRRRRATQRIAANSRRVGRLAMSTRFAGARDRVLGTAARFV